MKKLRRSVFVCMMLMLVFVLPYTSVHAATKVTNKTKTKSVVLVKGQSYNLKPSVKMKWKSSNTSVVSVNSSGVLKGLKKGSATVTGTYKTVKWIVKVKVETPVLNKTSVSLTKGSSYQLKVTGTTKSISWSSSQASVATVSSKGKITAKKAGTAYVTAKIGGVSFKCKVTVKNPAQNGGGSSTPSSVWIPQTGSKYHKTASCSNMNNPRCVSLSEAIRRGFEPCKRCFH